MSGPRRFDADAHTRKARRDRQEQNSGGCPEAGYSFVELLVAMGITLSILGSLFTLVNGWQIGFGAENERDR